MRQLRTQLSNTSCAVSRTLTAKKASPRLTRLLVGGWTTHAKSQSLDQSPSVYTTSFRCTKSCRSRSASFPEIAVSPGLLSLDGPHSSDLYLPESEGAGFTVNTPWLVSGIITSMAWNPWNFHAATNQILGKSGPKRRRVLDFPLWEKHPKQWFTSGFRDIIFSGKVDGTIVTNSILLGQIVGSLLQCTYCNWWLNGGNLLATSQWMIRFNHSTRPLKFPK